MISEDNTRFDLARTIEILERTPRLLHSMLAGLDDFWTASRGDPTDWEPFDIVGHLIHGERTDWIPRARLILSNAEDKTFVPFDRVAQFDEATGIDLGSLVNEFSELRTANLAELNAWHLGPAELQLGGTHPELGPVTLRQLIATWVVHDLNHIRQICVKLAGKYATEVGPWREYLSILK